MIKNELAGKIKSMAEDYSDYTALNLSKLVKIKSLSGEEKNVQEEVMRQMNEAGFDEVRMDGLGNVIGRIGNGKKILAIDGHIDTVDVGNIENWNIDPFSGAIRDGFVHGRGTVDQKGGNCFGDYCRKNFKRNRNSRRFNNLRSCQRNGGRL